jgi:hypothetical protein
MEIQILVVHFNVIQMMFLKSLVFIYFLKKDKSGKISFFRNGKKFGNKEAFTGLKKNMKLYPCFDFYTTNSKIQLL